MRLLKQSFYICALISLLLGGFYLLYYSINESGATCYDGRRNQGEAGADCGGPCQPCEENLQIVLKEKKIFPHTDIGRTSFFVELNNPSSSFWVQNFNYKLNVYDKAGLQISSFSGFSSIPPADSRKLAIIAADINPSDILRADLGIESPNWMPVKQYIADNISVHGVNVLKDENKFSVNGSLKNNSPDKVLEIAVGAVFKDDKGESVGISVVQVKELPAFSSDDFEIFWRSEGEAVDIDKTEVFVEKR